MRNINTPDHILVLISLYLSNVSTFKNSVLLSSIQTTIDICDDLWMAGLIEWHFLPYDSDPTIWITPKGRAYIESRLLENSEAFSLTHPEPVPQAIQSIDLEYIYREALIKISCSTNLNGIQCMGIAAAALREIDVVRAFVEGNAA